MSMPAMTVSPSQSDQDRHLSTGSAARALDIGSMSPPVETEHPQDGLGVPTHNAWGWGYRPSLTDVALSFAVAFVLFIIGYLTSSGGPGSRGSMASMKEIDRARCSAALADFSRIVSDTLANPTVEGPVSVVAGLVQNGFPAFRDFMIREGVSVWTLDAKADWKNLPDDSGRSTLLFKVVDPSGLPAGQTRVISVYRSGVADDEIVPVSSDAAMNFSRLTKIDFMKPAPPPPPPPTWVDQPIGVPG